MIRQRKTFRFGRHQVGHMADGARLHQCAHDRVPQGPGPAGDDHMTIAIVHVSLLRTLASRIIADVAPEARRLAVHWL